MNKDSESRAVILQTVVIILCSIVIFGILLFYFFHKLNDTKEWVFAFLTLVGSLLGGITTMLAIYKTIKHDNIQRNISDRKLLSEKEKNKKEKLNKLKMILKYEVEMFTEHCENMVLIFINSIISQWGKENIELVEIRDSDFYELTSNFKEFTYELLMISSEKDSEEIKRLLDFYNNFVNIKKEIKGNKNQYDIPRILSDVALSSEIKDLLYYVTVEQMWIKINKDLNEKFNIKIYTEKELGDKISKLYEEFESGTIHYNKDIKNIINFLEW